MVAIGVILEIFGILTILLAMAFLMTGDGSKEHKVMEYFLCGSLIQNIGYLMEWTAWSHDVAITAVKVEFVGCTVIPLLYCWFLYSYCYKKPPKKLAAALVFVDVAMMPFVFTLERHSLFFKKTTWLTTPSGHGYLHLDYGPLYPLFLLCWMIIPYLMSLYVLIHTIITRPEQGENRNYKTILLVSLLPISTYIAYALKIIRVFDPTPLALGLGLSFVVILIWNRRNYDFRHLASDIVLESIADGVIALDTQRRLIRCNRTATDIFPQLKKCRIGERIQDEDGFWESLLDDGMAHTLELDGRYYESHAKQITSESGKSQGYVLLILDFTDTRNYIDEIMEIRHQAEQANNAKSEFLANMSHEIRTPMNAIIGMSDIILEESQGLPIYSCAKDVQDAAKNLLAIINDILDLSKVEAGKMELVLGEYHIRTLVGEILGMMDVAASQRGLLMKYEYDMSIPCRYLGDEGRIKQILINLLNNAVKFTKEGHVKITVGGHPGPEGQEWIVFQVEDTGAGIREEDQEKIFENFKQVDSKRNRSAEGTGLGLAITRHLVRLMNGTLELESVYGQGSTFTVTIPQQIVDARPLSEVPEEKVQPQKEEEGFTAPDIKVLLVDDNAVNRKVARGFLKPYGLQVTEASSGFEAIEQAKKTAFDIIFMDHMMPEMDGIEATEHIRQECGENGANAVIIALTANAMHGVRESFLQRGFQDFVAKPLIRKPLDEVLRRWISEDKRKPKTADVAHKEQGSAKMLFIEGIDSDIINRQYSGDEVEYREILELYCLDGRRKLELLPKLAQSEDMKHYEVEVHGLKSASANIGATELSEMAKEQEMAARQKDRERVEQGFPVLLKTYETLLARLQSFLNVTQESASKENLDEKTLLQTLEDALALLEDFESKKCAGMIEDLLCYRVEPDIEASLTEIRDRLRLFEDEEAENLLRQLLQHMKQ